MGNRTGFFKSFLNLFLKSACPLCERKAESCLCLYCHRQLQQAHFPDFPQVEQKIASKRLPVFVWGVYGGILKRAIATMKYENHPELAKPLAESMAEAWLQERQLKKIRLTVVPIPLHPKKLAVRGFNQAELLAEHFCSVTGLPLQRDGLERIRETEAQFGLSPAQREANLLNAFSVGKGFRKGRFSGSVLLFDDIYTTGSTIRSAAETLQRAGVPVYGVVALAAPARRDAKD